MRLEVGTVRRSSQIALAGAVLAFGYGLFAFVRAPQQPLVSPAPSLHLIAAYGVTMLAFAAFPRVRRTDLVKLVLMTTLAAELARHLLGGAIVPLGILADAAGAFAAFIPSFLERFRSLTRADPHEPFSMVYPNDRRRRVRRAQPGGRSQPASA